LKMRATYPVPIEEYADVQTVLRVFESVEEKNRGLAEAVQNVFHALGALDVVE